MAWGRSNEEWNHTASIMTILAAINSDPKSSKKPALADYHPYMPEPERPTASPELLAAISARFARQGGK